MVSSKTMDEQTKVVNRRARTSIPLRSHQSKTSIHCGRARFTKSSVFIIATVATVMTSLRTTPIATAFQSWMRTNSRLLNKSVGQCHRGPFVLASPRMLSSPICTASSGIIPTSRWNLARSSPLKVSGGSRSNIHALMMTVDDDETRTDEEEVKAAESTWNIGGLKKEAARLTLRCHKKIGKASTRLENAKIKVEELKTDPDATLEQLEQCPDLESLEVELDYLRTRLSKLNELEGLLTSITKKKSVLPEDVFSLVSELDVKDEPPKRPVQTKKKKQKGPKIQAPRKPYRKYYSKDKTEIRVGKQAADNDELSLSPEHRDSADWWMHASGCPGSHVVIRSHDEQLNEEVVKDAAALAARQSKCAGANIKVSLTRCRNISKPRGAKPGLVSLNGSVRTVTVNMKEAESRLNRLDDTMVIN